VIAAYSDRIRTTRQENAGPATARNTGLGLVGGDLVAFLDADDIWLPDKLARQVARLDDRPEAMLCFSGIVNFREEPVPTGTSAEWPQRPFSPCTLLARRVLFDDVGLFNPSLQSGEDTEWFLRVMMRRIPYEVLPEILVRRRQHADNLTKRRPPSQDGLLRLVKMTLDKKRAEGW
jgi:glycosyltransferase involved in cell wall biosynthesis